MRAENNEKRKSVLKRLQSMLEQLDIGSKYLEKGVENSPFDLLAAAHEIPDVGLITGQYFFPEMEAAENVCYFTCMMTIRQNLSAEDQDAFRKRAEEINLSLACGQFLIYPEIGLVYKLALPVSEDLSEDDLFDTVDIAVAHALALSSAFALKICKG